MNPCDMSYGFFVVFLYVCHCEENVGCKAKATYYSLNYGSFYLGSLDTTRVLLEAGAKVNAENNLGRTAAQLGAFVGMKRLLNINWYKMKYPASHFYFLSIHTTFYVSVCTYKIQVTSERFHEIPRESVAELFYTMP